jgi:hypothetical protein
VNAEKNGLRVVSETKYPLATKAFGRGRTGRRQEVTMRVVGVSVPVLTGDIERAIPRYEALTGEQLKKRFIVPERGLTIALLGSVTLISGDEQALVPLRDMRATFIVDSIVD